MAHKTLIGGTAYEVSGGKTLIGGTAYSISGGRTLIGGTGYDVSLWKPFADSSWAEIIAACQNNAVPDTWAVGDQKTMTINSTDYTIDIIGKNHDTYSDGSGTAPLTFQMHDCYGTAQIMNTSNDTTGGWRDTAMRSRHLPAILALMPSEVQQAIKTVNKVTQMDGTDYITTADGLFLLSETEFKGTATYTNGGEGSQYAYYSAGNSAVKTLSGTNTAHWTRSPNKSSLYYFVAIHTSGSPTFVYASYGKGVAPAFCF